MFQNDAYKSPLRKYRVAAPSIPTLGDLAEDKTVDWCWAVCTPKCAHRAAVPLSAAIARVGADVLSTDFRSRLVCTACGHRGAGLISPSWKDISYGFQRLPADLVAVGLLPYWDDIRARAFRSR